MNAALLSLTGVGKKTAESLAQLHIHTITDLLFHLPTRYEDRTKLYRITALKPGDRVLIEGFVQSVYAMGARHYLRCELQDESGAQVDLIFYHMTSWHQKKLSHLKNKKIRCFGEVRSGFSGHLEIAHPEYALISELSENDALSLSPCLLPVYATTKGISQKAFRKLTTQALHLLDENHLPELLPEKIIQQENFLSLKEALWTVHFPKEQCDVAELMSKKHPAQVRLIFEELIAHQLSLQITRKKIQAEKAPVLVHSNFLVKKLLQQLPFELTVAQARVLCEIQRDLSEKKPMLRLLQGDVGSGKTIVAALSALQAIEAGYQVALMAPTEILCEQHYDRLSQWLTPLKIKIDILLGKQTASEQNHIKNRLVKGETQLIIGTHALFQEDVQFHQLAFLIIDEQHRFGVNQRLALLKKGLKKDFFPHQLMMTATPIPRTLTMTAYADLDCSVIDELPKGRKPISTVLISAEKRSDVIDRVRVNCELKKQAYWICTLIEESENLQCVAAEKTALELQTQLPGIRIGLIHGRLKSLEKNKIMQDFSEGKIELLVATTVVEVGVDVPNASLMIIENPERLGLTQLHQLRGRVGRGVAQSFCVLLYQSPLSEIAKKRLSVMRETQDGFLISEHDLQLRGPGEILGVQQSGLAQWRVVDLIRDQHLLTLAQTISKQLLVSHPELAQGLIARWIRSRENYVYA